MTHARRVTISVTDDGTPSVEIPDSRGRVRYYSVRLLEGDCFTARLTRRDTGDAHTTRLHASGAWDCTCGAWKYRPRGPDAAPGDCKHIDATRPLYHFLLRLFQEV